MVKFSLALEFCGAKDTRCSLAQAVAKVGPIHDNSSGCWVAVHQNSGHGSIGSNRQQKTKRVKGGRNHLIIFM